MTELKKDLSDPQTPFLAKPASEPHQPGELSPAKAPGPGMQAPQRQTQRQDGSAPAGVDSIDSDDLIPDSEQQARETD